MSLEERRERTLVSQFLGVPYAHQGRTLEGLDCYGIVILFYRELGYELYDIDGYPVNWCKRGRNFLLENFHKQWEKVEKPRPYDLVGFTILTPNPDHIGIYLAEDKFLHCSRQGVVISNLSDPRWKDNIEGYYHFKART